MDILDACMVKDGHEKYNLYRKNGSFHASCPAQLKVVSIAFDFFLEGLTDLQFLAFCDVTSKAAGPSAKASLSLLSAMRNDAEAIKLLCRSGLDVQARNLLRGLGEKSDLALACYLDEIFAQAFIDSSDFEDSRRFFFDQISKGRLKKRAKGLYRKAHPKAADLADWTWDEWRDELDLMLGSAVHPNHTVSLISLFPNIGRSRSEAISVGGWPTNGSIRTLISAIQTVSPLLLLAIDRPLFLPAIDDTDWQTKSDTAQENAVNLARFSLVLATRYFVRQGLIRH